MMEEKPDETEFECQLAREICIEEFGVGKHMETHDEHGPALCDDIFLIDSDFTTHLQRQLGRVAPCKICNETFVNKSDLKQHSEEHKKMIYACRMCEKVFNTKGKLNRHERKHKNMTVTCEVCNRWFTTKVSLRKHWIENHASVNTNVVECRICGKLECECHCMYAALDDTECDAQNKSDLSPRSVLVEHDDDKLLEEFYAKVVDQKPKCSKKHTNKHNFVCDVCQKTFTFHYSFVYHQRVHLGLKPFCCEFCGKGFTVKSSLNQHLRYHEEDRPYKCQHCSKGFITSTKLKVHLQRHEGELMFKCEICDRRFNTKADRISHRKRFHRISGLASECDICHKMYTECKHVRHNPMFKDSEKRKPCKCELCGKTYADNSGLKKHMLIHSGIKPFMCHVCEKSFSQKSSLKVHEMTHAGIKPYECEICQKSFSDKQNLLRHKRSHFAVRPYTCKLCDKSYMRSDHLQKHLKNVHLES